MSTLHPGRFMAELDNDFVVFLIGMRINRLLAIHKWLPVARAMSPMIAELSANPELGFLSAENFTNGRTTLMLSYWKSFEHLERYARGKTHQHLPAWKNFNRAVGENGSVGIWHETYRVRAGQYESIYGNMPRFGLAQAGRHLSVQSQRQNARDRIGANPKSAETFSTPVSQTKRDHPIRAGELS